MSSSRFTEKRIGYLAASQSFHPETEVLMLTTNMIRKDLNSPNMYDAGVALSSLACFISPDLARDLSSDIMTMLTSTKPYLRKKAVLILYKVFLRYPEALRPAFPRLREKLEDPDPGVQSAAVNVICELARKNPKNYLSLAPTFFKLMTTSTNNWMLIKIIKLFGALTPLEPRLGKKLIEPLTNLIHSTSAMSLLYECINTVIAVLISISSGMPNHTAAIQLCVQKLRILIEDSDQNLKYLGLMAMSKILKTNPKSVMGHKDLVMACLDDSDESIRLRALDLLYGMVSKKNLTEIVKKLMAHMDKAEGTAYRDELMEKIILICSQNDYQHVTNFEWYVSVLMELTRMEGTGHGQLIAAQLMDVAIRVESIREFAVRQSALLVENYHILLANSSLGKRNSVAEVLYAAAWICGEFPAHLVDPRETLGAMFRGRVDTLPAHITSVYIQNGLKLFSFVVKDYLGDETKRADVVELANELRGPLQELLVSSNLEVQERASTVLQLIKYVVKSLGQSGNNLDGDSLVDSDVASAAPNKAGKNGINPEDLTFLFAGELNPVGPKAQKKVPVPEGLDLDAWINEPPPESDPESADDEDEENEAGNDYEIFKPASNEDDDDEGERESGSSSKKKKKKKKHKKGSKDEPTEEEIQASKEARLMEQSMNPNYLKPGPSPAKSSSTGNNRSPVDDIPVQSIDLGVPLHIPGLASADQYLNISRDSSVKGEGKKKSKKGKKKKSKKRGGEEDSSEDDEANNPPAVAPSFVIKKRMEMPEGVEDSGGEEEDRLPDDDPHRALGNISLDDLEVIQPYKSKNNGEMGDGFREGDDTVPTNLFGGGKPEKKKKKKDKKENEDEQKVEKDKKKKKKHKKEKDELNGGEEKVSKKKKKKSSKDNERGKEQEAASSEAQDMDFWLSSEKQ